MRCSAMNRNHRLQRKSKKKPNAYCFVLNDGSTYNNLLSSKIKDYFISLYQVSSRFYNLNKNKSSRWGFRVKNWIINIQRNRPIACFLETPSKCGFLRLISNRSKMVSRVLKGIGASKIDIFLTSIVRSIQKEAKSGEDYHKISIWPNCGFVESF